MSEEAALPFDALVAIAWARVWSPVTPPPVFEAAWEALDLPDNEDVRTTAFVSTFHSGFPAPRVPLLLHAALNLSGDSVRMDVLRAMSHLGVKAGDHMLPPDHVAIACEVLASALVADEPVIVREIAARFLSPWCAAADARLDGSDGALRAIVRRFGMFVDAVRDAESILLEPQGHNALIHVNAGARAM